MSVKEIKSPTRGVVGHLHDIQYDKDSILVFQLPRKTSMLNDNYTRSALDALREIIPDNKKAIVIGADVNIYSIAGEDAVTLVLKGII